MSVHAKSARSVLLAGLVLSLAAAWCVPLVQGRLLQGRGDHEDGGYSYGSSNHGRSRSDYSSGRQGSQYSHKHQSWGYDNDSEGESDSSSSDATPAWAPKQQPAGNAATAPANALNPATASTIPSSTSNEAPTTTTPATSATPTTPTVQPSAGTTAAGPADPVLNDVLALHNQLRAKHSAPPLTWSTLLEQSAMAWASGCNHEHSTNRAGNYNELNAWGNRPFTQAVQDQWYAEIKGYNFNSPPSRWQENTAHFTQSTTELGCGYATCSDGPYYVCHYAPTGNTNGGFAANVSPPAA